MTPDVSSTPVFWLPALNRIAPDHPLRRWLSRADRLESSGVGYLPGLQAYFDGAGESLPAAALMRESLEGGAGDTLWLAADPAWVQPDMNGVRLLACGQWQLSREEAESLAAAVAPAIADAGLKLHVTTPDRWHLELPAGTTLPPFAAPEQALGEDLSQHLPQGPEGRRWRILLNDIQVLLHQHPLNAERRAQGLALINSLWLWGGGALPPALHSALRGVVSDDVLLRAMAHRCGLPIATRTAEALAQAGKGWLFDLQDLPAEEFGRLWWPALEPVLLQRAVVLHFASGERWQVKPWHRLRVWRRALPRELSH